ncbi:hypothetical protein KBW81_18360 (plasmid) [Loktanella salsilacus]|uniref:NaeI family type II restriction endonuclease n=1 Tax=Loktanella salsilacus TaxID=195913 RepID=UPI0020B873AB|nr:NaeI family type II restriction endonuclease [Loktanella salsilacus]UTH50142.1 hypothetical protein KBW81_18360 [Loktanella salsilacus]
MKVKIPRSKLQEGHFDFNLLTRLRDEIVRRAGGMKKLREWFGPMLRENIDGIIDTPTTGRIFIDELENTEKTYLGTRVELELRNFLDLQRGLTLDLEILGMDIDVKNTTASNWMIPSEAIGHSCLVVAADENRALFFVGLIFAHSGNLTQGKNKDGKGTLSSPKGFSNILWIFQGEPYQRNLWTVIPKHTVDFIFSLQNGNARVAELFRQVTDTPIDRKIANGAARQSDFTRRIRSDKSKGTLGTRDVLALEGYLLLNGKYDRKLIKALCMPDCKGSEWISHKIADMTEETIAASFGKTARYVP